MPESLNPPPLPGQKNPARGLLLLGALLLVGIVLLATASLFVFKGNRTLMAAIQDTLDSRRFSAAGLVGSWRCEEEKADITFRENGEYLDIFQQKLEDKLSKSSVSYRLTITHQIRGTWSLHGHTLKLATVGNDAKVSDIQINTATYAASQGEDAAKELRETLIANFSRDIPAKLNDTAKGAVEEATLITEQPNRLLIKREDGNQEYRRVANH